MDFLSCMLLLFLAWTLVQTFKFIARETTTTKLPPGPTPFPIIGNLFELGNKPHKSLTKLSKTYGPIMALKLGNITTIVISSATLAKEVLQKQDLAFANRFIPDAIRAHNHHKVSVAWIPVSSPKWRTLRKICNTNIFANRTLEANQHLRHQKVKELLDDVRESCKAGDAVEIGRAAFNTTLNLISNTVFSVDMASSSLDDDKAGKLKLKELVWDIMEEAGKPNFVDYFPILRKIDLHSIRRRMTGHFGKILELFDSLIHKRLESRKYSHSDVMDTLLNIIEDDNDQIDRTDVQNLLLDLFSAGTDTTSSTLEWAMTEVLCNPKILSKAKAEVEEIIGKDNPIEESHITQLPYLQAIVKETFRFHPAVPFLLPRQVEADVELCAYTIPKGSQVLVNAWAIGRDSSTWTNPDTFDPERFLGSSMDVRGCDFELIPFGAGRRICPGLPLASRMIHLMLGSLIHSFDWKLQDGVGPQEIDMDDRFGLTLQKAQPLYAVPIHG